MFEKLKAIKQYLEGGVAAVTGDLAKSMALEVEKCKQKSKTTACRDCVDYRVCLIKKFEEC